MLLGTTAFPRTCCAWTNGRPALRGYLPRVELAPYTTLRLGGPARAIVDARSEDELVQAARDPGAILLAGGSNVVVADEGVDATVVRVLTRGVELRDDGERVLVRAAAGERWDELVARCVAEGLAGVECLAGIPGSVGATPIQNVGAYGQEVADTLVAVRALDRRSGAIEELPPQACGFGYRTSAFKRDPGRRLVLDVTLALARGTESAPVRYAELARALGVQPGGRAPLAATRDAVLALRRGKGMVLDDADHDTWSAGSFFTNPFVAPDRLPDGAPAFPQPDGSVKTSAAWLIERAGFTRGYGDPATIAISSKHTLALTNRGAGTTAQLVALAREIRDGVRERFGVTLVPEPVFLGLAWEG
jgi:UDP-N-acetylmuramate dehydrogenase